MKAMKRVKSNDFTPQDALRAAAAPLKPAKLATKFPKRLKLLKKKGTVKGGKILEKPAASSSEASSNVTVVGVTTRYHYKLDISR